MPYPDVSKVQTVPIDTVFARCLRDVCCDCDDKRDGHVLEYKEPGPLITTGEPITHGASENPCRNLHDTISSYRHRSSVAPSDRRSPPAFADPVPYM